MSGQLPIIDELDEISTQAAAAAWLMTCPLGVIALHHEQIRAVLSRRDFPDVAACLDAELALAMSQRSRDGLFRQYPSLNAHLARAAMLDAV